jgi:signal transduction histidine kinase
MATIREVGVNAMQPSNAGAPTGRSPLHDSRREDTFVATLAHELRQPLSAMLAAVEVVRAAPDLEAARRAVHVMRRQISQMNRLVEDLVDTARWASGKVTLHKCRLDLRDVLRDAAADVRNTVEGRGQELIVAIEPEPVWVDGDSQRLQQVVSNLLRNAVHHTQPGGQISMAIERLDSIVTLRVGDTGRGIDTTALPRVFDLFSQARPQEGIGLGIGLNVVREIVLLHGGSIEARSDGAWKGSEFIVRLPFAERRG